MSRCTLISNVTFYPVEYKYMYSIAKMYIYFQPEVLLFFSSFYTYQILAFFDLYVELGIESFTNKDSFKFFSTTCGRDSWLSIQNVCFPSIEQSCF